MHVLFLCVLLGWSTALFAVPTVVTTIKPVHSLVSGVMQGVGRPQLLVPEGASAHHYQLTPRDFGVLEQAELVFWIGPRYESFLVKPLQTLRAQVTQIPLMASPGMKLLLQREGSLWESDHHHDHDHEDKDLVHAGSIDPHFWLDPLNAINMVYAIATVLAEKDPLHASLYAQNAAHLENKLRELDKSLKTLLLDVQKRPFLVFHDGLQYFEKRYQLDGHGAIVLDPQLPPSAKRLQAVQRRLQQGNIVCVLREPEFNAAILQGLTEHMPVQQAQIDTLAVFAPRGQEAYFTMMHQLGSSVQKCLAP